MTRRIFKYRLDVKDRQYVMMPRGARILSVQDQHGLLEAWALVDPDAPECKRDIRIHGTGRPIGATVNLRGYVASVQQRPFVWHVFDNGEVA